MVTQSPQLAKAVELWKLLQLRKKTGVYTLDGNSLTIADVVATSLYDCKPLLSQDPKINKDIQDSINVLFDHLAQGWYVYGVNTGFGGSADSRTDQVTMLQASLMQHTQSGIISKVDKGGIPDHVMPRAWVRASMVIRCNSTMRGHSAVSFPVVKAMAELLGHDLTPVVPLRGSVSASGDLMPLSYVAGGLEGNPDILIQKKNGTILSAPEALKEAGLEPVTLGPKEGLGLINGTSSSAGVGAIVLANAHMLAFLTQLLTGSAVEALCGSSESFHPFIAETRPHPGQIECARNVYSFLRGSHLARDVLAPKNRKREDLVQDRYSLRSAPQWIGPQLEDLLLADQQINIEINSSCDNPLIDSKSSDIYYGANFQAASVTSAMEKIRLVLQMFGKILFSQSFEMIDPNLSGGLPANLAADNPSLSFTMKGVDVNMAAYMAELAYLANPMSSHVQAAEMHNQSVNSMALASARMSADAVDILMKMCACHIYVVCQALDLRALHLGFVKKVTETINTLSQRLFLKDMTSQDFEALQDTLGAHIGPSWSSTGKLDLEARCQALVNSIVPILLDHIQGGIENVVNWKNEANNLVWNLWRDHFSAFIENPDTPTLLGRGSSALYDFVRDKLQVPFHQGFIEHPTYKEAQLNSRQKKTIGGWISIIHDSIDNGTLYDNLMIMLDNSSVSLINGKK